jgi:triosephosphate isomerase
VVVCPPFPVIKSVYEALEDCHILVGAQDVFHEDSGAYTGAVSPLMLEGLCDYIIVGHSERRKHFGDTDEDVAMKIGAVLRHGMRPILCVGETLEENETGRTIEVLQRQLSTALGALPPSSELAIAYEPVWAIGTGRAARGDDVNATLGWMRGLLGRILDENAARNMCLLYGGSVTPENTAEFVSQSEIDGTLVGGASLRAPDFCEIVFRTASYA